MARFAPPDKLVFTRAGSLYAITFDTERVETAGQPVLVMEGVGGDPSSGAGYFDLSRTGDLIYVEGAITAARSNVVLIDREGQRTTLPIEPRGFFHPRFSPDGESMAFAVGVGSLGVGGDIWVYSFRDQGLRRVSFGGSDIYPLWRPDGVEIAFIRSSDSSLASKAADGSGDARVLLPSTAETLLPESWTPDHGTIALSRTGASTDVQLLAVEQQELHLFAEDASAPTISPDGRWLAYSSPASGNSTVYVRRVDGDGKWQVSPSIGGYPRWSADGRKLFYIALRDADRPVMEVDVVEGDTFRSSMPRVVVPDTKRYLTSTAPVVNWDTDGERFAFVELMRDEETLFRVEVALNWARQLKDVSP